MTSPNMQTIPAPISICETRLRKANNFAKDDPSWWPQPYHDTIGHLAVIPCPSDSQSHPLCYAWYQPAGSDFELVQTPGLSRVVCLAPSVSFEVTYMCDTLRESISALPEALRNDSYLRTGRDRMRKYCERLSQPGAREVVALLLACLQRSFLETYGRWQWLVKWKPRKKDVDTQFPVDSSVMGAFTDDYDIAADLFRMGIPLWFLRRWREESDSFRIDNIVAPLDFTYNLTLPIRGTELFLDVSHTDPPHPVVYTGLPGSFTRYIQMARYIQQQFSTSLVGSFNALPVPISTSLSVTLPSSSPQAISHPTSRGPSQRQRKANPLDALDVTSSAWVSVPPPEQRARTAGSSGAFLSVFHCAFLILF